MPRFTRTDVKATEQEHESIMAAANMPAIMIGGSFPETAQQVAHRYALAHGLPEVTGYYGYNPTTREFLGPA